MAEDCHVRYSLVNAEKGLVYELRLTPRAKVEMTLLIPRTKLSTRSQESSKLNRARKKVFINIMRKLDIEVYPTNHRFLFV